MKYAFIFLFIMIGIGIPITLRNLLRALASKNWKVVPAKVLESTIEEKFDTEIHRLRFRPIITYQYSFQEKTYENDNYDFKTEWLSREHAVSIMSNYGQGKEIQIYMNPNKPKLSVIVPGAQFGHFLAFGICVFFFSAFLYAMIR